MFISLLPRGLKSRRVLLKCAYWQSQCHWSMQMSSVRRWFIVCFISARRRRRRRRRRRQESGWKLIEAAYQTYQTYQTCHMCTWSGSYKQQLLLENVWLDYLRGERPKPDTSHVKSGCFHPCLWLQKRAISRHISDTYGHICGDQKTHFKPNQDALLPVTERFSVPRCYIKRCTACEHWLFVLLGVTEASDKLNL